MYWLWREQKMINPLVGDIRSNAAWSLIQSSFWMHNDGAWKTCHAITCEFEIYWLVIITYLQFDGFSLDEHLPPRLDIFVLLSCMISGHMACQSRFIHGNYKAVQNLNWFTIQSRNRLLAAYPSHLRQYTSSFLNTNILSPHIFWIYGLQHICRLQMETRLPASTIKGGR